MSHNHSPVALITGSGSERVGNVIARELAKDGYQIAVHYRTSEEEAKETRQQLQQLGVKCEIYQADVSAEDEAITMVQKVVADFGRVDVVVTSSSIWPTESFEETTADSILKSFQVNTLGTFSVAKAAGLQMVDQETGGCIVTIGDWKIDRPYLDHAAYFIAKGSIPTLTKVLALELGHRNPNVRVNCIHPGPVMFPPGTSEEEQQSLIESTLVKKADCPETVAHAVKFFVNNPFVTGASIPVDGGQHFYSPDAATRKRD